MGPVFQSYIGRVAALTLVLTATLIAVCLAVDPFRMLALAEMEGVNRRKPEASGQVRLAKAHDVVRARPKSLFIGNSRVEVGFDPAEAEAVGLAGPVFNYGVPGAGLFEQMRVAQHAIATGQVTHLLGGLDFVDFLTDQATARPDPYPSSVRPFEARLLVDRNWQPNRQRWRAMIDDSTTAFLSMQSLVASALTVTRQSAGHPNLLPNGFNPLDEYHAIVRAEGHFLIFAQRDRENLQQRLRGPKGTFHADRQSGPMYRILDRFLDDLCRRNIKVTLFTHPYHLNLLQILDATGLWTELGDWKRELSRVVAGAAQRCERPDLIELWDFTVVTEETTEPVPARGDVRSKMRWYWEAGHYKSTLGTRMMATMLTSRESPEFGLRLSPDRVDEQVRVTDERYLRQAGARGKLPATLASAP